MIKIKNYNFYINLIAERLGQVDFGQNRSHQDQWCRTLVRASISWILVKQN